MNVRLARRAGGRVPLGGCSCCRADILGDEALEGMGGVGGELGGAFSFSTAPTT